ncbi:50S ribosomal protein L7/L12 [Philodulcilactobacillus myokoensis]|uniref:Large ribosomal subunit protein bL12 n=1 Tax=Philodulcilactobacillus myokoensis TaxID=2929573 RepID=A0A9W6B1I0_9LACO|nr:50S ribosomal protein L7/L12 [Philodulcilactobacillus myokoensis]GLB47170.1 50S ribosomal protein L7/L12 [Philodulcilactobacillus myokoensis]
MAFDKDNIIDQLKDASITDLNDLVKSIEKEFDVKAAAPVAAAGGNAGGGAAKTNFTVELTEAGASKVKVIKAVREATGLGLMDSKKLVDKVPSKIKEDVPKADAEDLKKKIEASGAKVTLK